MEEIEALKQVPTFDACRSWSLALDIRRAHGGFGFLHDVVGWRERGGDDWMGESDDCCCATLL